MADSMLDQRMSALPQRRYQPTLKHVRARLDGQVVAEPLEDDRRLQRTSNPRNHRTKPSTPADRWLAAFARGFALWRPFFAVAIWRDRTSAGQR